MKILQKGDNGDEVIFLQRLLKKIYPNMVVDGDFGNNTDANVKKFQKANKLGADGIVGPKTFSVLSVKAVPDVFGTDVYRHDVTDTDAFWQDLEQNYWFCFAKASQGSNFADNRFGDHLASLKEHNILRGGYHFPLLLNANVTEEANYFLDTCKKAGVNWQEKGVLPPVYDVEPLTEAQAKLFPAQSKTIATRMKIWLELVEKKTSRKPIIYTSRRVWDELLKSPQGFERYSLWVANYGNIQKPKLPSIWKGYAFWQFTDSGTIGGVKGFDVDKIGIELNDLLTMANY